jgi:hypothetical protein
VCSLCCSIKVACIQCQTWAALARLIIPAVGRGTNFARLLRVRQFPLPHWIIWENPALACVNMAVHRATTYLCWSYWRSGCQPLPSDMITQAQLAWLPLQHYRPIQNAVLKAFQQIKPELDKAFHRASRIYEWQANHARTVTNRHRLIQSAKLADQPFQPKLTAERSADERQDRATAEQPQPPRPPPQKPGKPSAFVG